MWATVSMENIAVDPARNVYMETKIRSFLLINLKAFHTAHNTEQLLKVCLLF